MSGLGEETETLKVDACYLRTRCQENSTILFSYEFITSDKYSSFMVVHDQSIRSVCLEIICSIICWISGSILIGYGVASLGNHIPVFWGNILSSSLKFGMSQKIFFCVSGSSYPFTQHYISEKWNPQPHYCGNLKPCWTLFVCFSLIFFSFVCKFAGIASGSMMNSGPPPYSAGGMGRGNSYDFSTGSNPGSNEYSGGGGPLSHLSDSVNSLDPLNAMEKTLNEQVSEWCWVSLFVTWPPFILFTVYKQLLLMSFVFCSLYLTMCLLVGNSCIETTWVQV